MKTVSADWILVNEYKVFVWQKRELTCGPSYGLIFPDQPSRHFMKNFLVSLLISDQWGKKRLRERVEPRVTFLIGVR